MYWTPLVAFACALAVFHVSEYALAWKFMRQECSLSSLLFSRPYCLAMTCALLEYTCEDIFWPFFKPSSSLLFGIALIFTGEILRKSAMITAKQSFTHSLQFRDHPTNQLVTSGPYRFLRHPGYLGWLIWAVGTQVLLCNPICSLLFASLACIFFRRRIEVEEEQLRQHFGDAYVKYAASSVASTIALRVLRQHGDFGTKLGCDKEAEKLRVLFDWVTMT